MVPGKPRSDEPQADAAQGGGEGAGPQYHASITAAIRALQDFRVAVTRFGQTHPATNAVIDRDALTAARTSAFTACQLADPVVRGQIEISIARIAYDTSYKMLAIYSLDHPYWRYVERPAIQAFIPAGRANQLLLSAKQGLKPRNARKYESTPPFADIRAISPLVRRVPVSSSNASWKSTSRKIRSQAQAVTLIDSLIVLLANTWLEVSDDAFKLSYAIAMGNAAARRR